MFQIGVAVEGQISGKIATLTVGVGLAQFANRRWYENFFGIIAQGAVGVRRYGLILFGFFVTLQFVDVDGARKSILGAQIQKSSAHGKNASRPRSR